MRIEITKIKLIKYKLNHKGVTLQHHDLGKSPKGLDYCGDSGRISNTVGYLEFCIGKEKMSSGKEPFAARFQFLDNGGKNILLGGVPMAEQNRVNYWVHAPSQKAHREHLQSLFNLQLNKVLGAPGPGFDSRSMSCAV